MRLAAALLVALSLSACASNRPIRFKSDPAGAKVMRKDKVLGVTPFITDMDALFPYRAWDGKPMSSITLVFEKEGYEEGVFLAQEWSVPPVIEMTLTPLGKPAAVPGGKPSIEERLLELEGLRQRGLITEEEYQRKRQELLNQL